MAADRPRRPTLFNARINRLTFWISFSLVLTLVALIATFARQRLSVSESVLMLLAVPRLHDIGRSGWWVLVPFALEVAAVVIAFAALPVQVAILAATGVTILIAGALIWLGSVKGDAGENRFGPPPPRGFGMSGPGGLRG